MFCCLFVICGFCDVLILVYVILILIYFLLFFYFSLGFCCSCLLLLVGFHGGGGVVVVCCFVFYCVFLGVGFVSCCFCLFWGVFRFYFLVAFSLFLGDRVLGFA